MEYIVIEKVPPGDAPEEVRKQWVGVKVPYIFSDLDVEALEESLSVIDGAKEGGRAYEVNFYVATDALLDLWGQKQTAELAHAYCWWIQRLRELKEPRRGGETIFFAHDACRVVTEF